MLTVSGLLGNDELAIYGAGGDEEALKVYMDGLSRNIPELDLILAEVEMGLPALIRNNRSGIERVAQELYNNREISGKERDNLLEGILHPKGPLKNDSLWTRIKRWVGLF